MLISHVDLRVRDRARGEAFYDPIFTLLGATMSHGKTFTTWEVEPGGDGDWLGITEDPELVPSPNRIALLAPSRAVVDAIFAKLPALGARNIEAPDEAYGPQYYACFFDDPDGNRLEVCALG